jgi:hypothetical protein
MFRNVPDVNGMEVRLTCDEMRTSLEATRRKLAAVSATETITCIGTPKRRSEYASDRVSSPINACFACDEMRTALEAAHLSVVSESAATCDDGPAVIDGRRRSLEASGGDDNASGGDDNASGSDYNASGDECVLTESVMAVLLEQMNLTPKRYTERALVAAVRRDIKRRSASISP